MFAGAQSLQLLLIMLHLRTANKKISLDPLCKLLGFNNTWELEGGGKREKMSA